MTSDSMLLFGRIARKHRFVLPHDLEECLVIQEKLRLMGGSRRLGDILIDQGYLTPDHVTWVLARQARTEPAPPLGSRFGEIAVLNGLAPRGAVQRALKAQAREAKKATTRKIGEILVADGMLEPSEKFAILALQARVRSTEQEALSHAEAAPILVLEAGSMHRARSRFIIVGLITLIAAAVLAALIAYMVVSGRS